MATDRRTTRRRLIGRILLVPALAIGVLLAWQAPQAFALTGLFQSLASQFLGAQVDNRYSGGPVMAKFRDRAGDDNGAGSLEYPLHESFQTGHVLDLLAYTVHQPVVANLPFVPDTAYWQIDFTMGELGPAIIHDYIDLDGSASGSTESAENGNEGVEFDPAQPWDLFIEVNVAAGTATMQEAGSESVTKLSVYRNQARKNLMVRIPLDRASTKRILDGRSSWHYVLVGAWDDYARGHFMPIAAKATLRSAGGSDSRLTPRVFDWLAPEGSSQPAVLAAFDEAAGSLPRVIPVEAKPGLDADPALDEKRLAELETQAKSEQEAEAARLIATAKAAIAAAPVDSPPSLELAMNFLMIGDSAKAEAIYDALLRQDAGNLVARAQKGTLISARCLTAKSLDETISFVNQAFAELDLAYSQAEKLGLGAPSALPWEAFAQLCFNVPEVPFGRSRAGAAAFQAAARWQENAARNLGEAPEAAVARQAIARDLLMAGLCFEKAQGAAEAETCFLQASSVSDRDATTRLELARRGYF